MPIRRPDRGRGKKKGKAEFRINGEVQAPEVRVIDEEGKMVGVISSGKALSLAEDRGLDLIEIAPTAKPPTCRIMDYGKWKYENKKKAVQSRKKQTVIVIKEIQIRPRTDQHDLDVKMRHARRFLAEGDKVKINLRFMGREMAHQEIGLILLNKVTALLDDVCMIESPPKKEGRHMFVLLAPDPVKIKALKKEKDAASKSATESTTDKNVSDESVPDESAFDKEKSSAKSPEKEVSEAQ